MSEENDVPWGLAQRLEFVEWRVYWAGRLNRKDLEDEFQISTPQVSLDLRRYQEVAPGNIEYNATEKCYVATSGFSPKFLKLSPERYLLQLQALHSEAIRKSDTWFDKAPPADTVLTIVRGPQAFTLRAIIKAIDMKGSIEINYHSLTKTAMRTICPHSLAHDGLRWHVRALSQEHGEYRDYVLGRILSFSEPKPCDADPSDDLAWEKRVKLKLIAHPKLSSQQKTTIEHDYQLQKGELLVDMRLALAFYFIKRYNLDLRNNEVPPERAQLFLQNYEEIEAALKESKEQSKTLIAARRLKISSS